MSLAMVFPGQGSQSVGMLAALTEDHPVIRATFDEASTALGYDLGALIFNGPKEELDRTERTQPALLAAGIALWRAWQAAGGAAPVALAGHSLGEYTALVAAGSLRFADALRLVALRGQLMQSAVPEGTGGMVAVIGMDDAAVEALCADYEGPGLIAPANYNAPGQVVVAGQTQALDWLMANAKARGARMVMRVGMSVPSHCHLLAEAAVLLGSALAQVEVHVPRIPVLHNLDAQTREVPQAIREALAAQLHQPVRWTTTLQALQQGGVTRIYECGPGKVLAGLVKRTLDGVAFSHLDDPAAFNAALAAA